MIESKTEMSIIASFAKACERLNDFSHSLKCRFNTIRAGADIRFYQSGWRLEKYVEAELNPEQGYWIAWWIELGQREENWRFESSVSISHAAFYSTVDEFETSSAAQFEDKLKAAMDNLETSLTWHEGFINAVAELSAPEEGVL